MLVKVPAFNPLRTEEARMLKLLPIPTVMKRINAVEDDADEQFLEQLGENEVEMRQDEDPVQEVQSSSYAWRSSYSLIFKARRYCNSRFSYRKLAEIRQAYA